MNNQPSCESFKRMIELLLVFVVCYTLSSSGHTGDPAFVLTDASGQGCITSVKLAGGTASTCEEWASVNRLTSGKHNATIDPDGDEQEFGETSVVCDLDTEPGKACVVLHHNQEERTFVDGYDSALSYRVTLQYEANIETVKKIADVNMACKQYIKYECMNAVHDFSVDSKITRWINRYNDESTYFTGNGAGQYFCDCAPYGTCGYFLGCRCNENDDVWGVDEGYITNKADLPIRAFAAGDTGYNGPTDERAYHTIGPLICC